MTEVYTRGYWKSRFMFYNLWEPSPLQRKALHIMRASVGGRGVRIIDLGCGDGRHLYGYHAEGLLQPSDLVVGIDISYEALKLTKYVVPNSLPVGGSVLQLPFKKESCDLLLCSMLIEHVPDDLLLQEIKRVLTPGGILHLITVIRRPYAPFRARSSEGHLVLARNHLREYRNSQVIISLVEKHGFRTMEEHTSIFRVSLLHRLMMLGIKLGLFEMDVKNRLKPFSPQWKKIMSLLALQVPILGYYIFEGMFIAEKGTE